MDQGADERDLGGGRGTLVSERRQMLRHLEEAVATVTSELSLEDVLARINTAARDLVGARYSAIAVLSEGPERHLVRFVHDSLDPDAALDVDALPSGEGLLGEIVHEPRSVRRRDISDESTGGAGAERPAESFLGVPVRHGTRILGVLYLTHKVDGAEFTEMDESVVVALAAAAGVAIESARLFQLTTRRQAWLSASVDITARLTDQSLSAEEALQLVADRARDVSGADISWVVAGSDPANLHIEVVSGAPVDRMALAQVRMEDSLASRVIRSGEPMSVEDITTDSRAVDPSTLPDWPPLGPVMLLPLRSAKGVIGVLTLAWTRDNAAEFQDVDPILPAAFAEQAALTLQVARSLRDERRLALYEERDRIARDLHDLVVQRLFAVGLGLQVVLNLLPEGETFDRVTRALEDIDGTISDIRRTIFALGKMDGAADLQSEIERLVERAAGTLKIRPRLYLEGPLRTALSPELAADVLAVVTEALSNVARHARASTVEVRVSVNDWVEVVVADDGRGIEDAAAESGLSNMRDRARDHGGDLEIVTAPDDGTTLRWRVPYTRS